MKFPYMEALGTCCGEILVSQQTIKKIWARASSIEIPDRFTVGL